MKISKIKDFKQKITCIMGVVNAVDDNSRKAVLEVVSLNELVLPNGDSKTVQTGKEIQARKDEMLIIRPSIVAVENNISIAEGVIVPGEKMELTLHITNTGMSQADIPREALLAEVFSVGVVAAKAADKEEEPQN